MKTTKTNQHGLILAIVVSFLYFPVLGLWLSVGIDFIMSVRPMPKLTLHLVLTSIFMISTAILTWLSRILSSLNRRFAGTVTVCVVFSIVSIVPLVMGEVALSIGAFIAVAFILVASLIDKPLCAYLAARTENRWPIGTFLYDSGIILLAWAIGFLFPLSERGSSDTALMSFIALMGYACLVGRLYDIFVSRSPKAWLTRSISTVSMITLSLSGIIGNYSATDSGSQVVYIKSIVLFWTTVGILLYDLGCFVAGRIGKKLATKKQDSLEETAEA